MAASGKTFFRAARFLPRTVRDDVVQLYAFCRRVDDLADEPSSLPKRRRSDLELISGALRRNDTASLQSIGWPFPTDRRLIAAAALLVEAACDDLDQQQPRDKADLLCYAFGVAGTVGMMMATLLRAQPAGYSAAVALGMAMQLSNIARDVSEDHQNGRVYLPSNLVSAATVHAALQQGRAPDCAVLQTAIFEVLALAEVLYQAAYDGIWSLPWTVRWSILAAAMCYRQIGVQVKRNVERSWQTRTVVSSSRKYVLIAFAAFRLLLPRFWHKPDRTLPTPSLGEVALRHMRQFGVA